MEESEFRTALGFEAQELIPIPVDDAILDFQILDRFHNEDGEERMRVLLAAAPRTVVERQLEALRIGGVRAAGVDVVSLGLLRAMVGDVDVKDWLPGAEVLVSVGSDVTNIVVHEHGVLRFARTLTVGGQMVTDALVEAFSITPGQAETLKRNVAEAGESARRAEPVTKEAAKEVREAVNRLADDIAATFDYYNAQVDASRIIRVLLTGGASATPYLAKRLEKRVGTSVVVSRSFDRVKVASGLDLRDSAAAAERLVTVSIGYALHGALHSGSTRGISLLPASIAAKKEERRQMLVMGAALSALVIGLMTVWLVRGIQLGSAERARDRQIAATEVTKESLLQFSAVQAVGSSVGQQRVVINQALLGDVSHATLLRQIATVLPSDVSINGLSIRRGDASNPASIVLSGQGTSPNSAGATVTALRTLPALTNVWVGTTSVDQSTGAVRFDLTAQVTTAAASTRGPEITGATTIPATAVPVATPTITTTTKAGK
jgi:type IV pilus assembly protein PilM